MSERFPSKMVIAGGHRLLLHGLSDQDPYWTSIHDDFEPEFQRLCDRLIRPDYVCLDVGANIGFKSLLLAKHCPLGQVIAVEAGPTVASCLAENLQVNAVQNAQALHAAASEQSGTVSFSEHSAWGHVGDGTCTVDAVTLEDIVQRYALERLDFVKIDVEGNEFAVLRRAMTLLNRFDPLLLVELNSLTLLVWGQVNPLEFLNWLAGNFRYIYAVNRDPTGPLLTPVETSDQCRAILHRNLIDDHCVTDLLLSNAAQRFEPSAEALEQQLKQHQSEVASLSAALQNAHAERDALLASRNALVASRDALLASTSWRASRPLRWVGGWRRQR